jgi:hypothetical protein
MAFPFLDSPAYSPTSLKGRNIEETRTKISGDGTVHGQLKIRRSLGVRAAGFQKGHQIKISRRESSEMGFITGFTKMAP